MESTIPTPEFMASKKEIDPRVLVLDTITLETEVLVQEKTVISAVEPMISILEKNVDPISIAEDIA